jgi:predicted dehydrogenase
MICVGDRGSFHLGQIARLATNCNARIRAVCDVWQVNLRRAAERVKLAFGDLPRTCTRFGELISDEQVDAVVIATPDFGHAAILLEALEAGKDAYVEKPMALDVGRPITLHLADRRTASSRWEPSIAATADMAAARELAGGVLGKVHRIHASANFNQARWARDYSSCNQADVDWPAYLFNRKQRPFDPKLLRRWQLYRDFTNGLPGLWMTHYVDAVHLLTGAKYPASAVALGGNYIWHDGREHTDTFHAVLEYPEGFLFDWSMCLGNSAGTEFQVFGTKATLDLGANSQQRRFPP